MSNNLAPLLKNLLIDNFADDPDGPVSSTIWNFPTGDAEFIPSTIAGAPGTETAGFLPSVSNGVLDLQLQTYNPTALTPGDSFLGSAIFSNLPFSLTTPGTGIAFTAVARLGTAVPGMDGGIFSYGLNSASNHSEIDFESLSDNVAEGNNQEQTNIYQNAPTNSVGNPASVADQDLTVFHTYTIEWFPSEVLWFIDGTLVRTNTTSVPQGAMQFYLNFWAYDAHGALQTASSAAANTTYNFFVQSARVDSIEDLNTTLTVNGTVANQMTSDTSGLSPFKSVVVTDLNSGQTDAVTVTMSDPSNGTLTNLGGGQYNSTTGVYTISGTAATDTAALDGLLFSPTAHQAPAGQTVMTSFTINVTDTAEASATDSTTSVIASETAASTPILSGLTVNQQIELIYIAYFNRAADGAGFAYWQGQDVQAQEGGQSAVTALTNIANAFAPQPETEALYPSLAPYLGTSNPPPLNTIAGMNALTSFITGIYGNLFDRAADTAGQAYWVAQLATASVALGAAALAIANGATGADAIEVLNKISVGLDFTTRTSAAGLGETAQLPNSFVTASHTVLSGVDGASLNDATVTAGENATTTYIASATTTSSSSQVAIQTDPGVITISGSGQLVDPGTGSHTIQFLANTSADTLVLHADGVDQVSGFTPGTDVLDIGSLLTEAGVDLNGSLATLGNYVTVTDQGANALINFDPTGHAGGGTVAVLQGLGGIVTNLNTLQTRIA